MTKTQIKFGTSGWRGVIADTFTFSGVRRAAAAIAGHAKALKPNPTIVVGNDTRFFSPEFARSAASVLRANGCTIKFCPEPTPTPVIAHAIIFNKFDGGVNITASHNPAEYNGLKFSGPDGGPALPEITKDIEKRADALPDDETPFHDIEDNFDHIDPRAPYFEQLKKMIRFGVLAKLKGATFAYDALHGCGAGWLNRILEEHGIAVHSIRLARNPLFDGSGPDPSEENLAGLGKLVLERDRHRSLHQRDLLLNPPLSIADDADVHECVTHGEPLLGGLGDRQRRIGRGPRLLELPAVRQASRKRNEC